MQPGEWEQRQHELDTLLKLIHRLRDGRDSLAEAERNALDAELERLLGTHREAREQLVAPESRREPQRTPGSRSPSLYYGDIQRAVERAMARFGAPD